MNILVYSRNDSISIMNKLYYIPIKTIEDIDAHLI